MKRIGLTEIVDNLSNLDNWQFVRLAREMAKAGAEKISETTGQADALIFLQALRDAATEAEAIITRDDPARAQVKEKADRYFRLAEAKSRGNQ